MGNGVNYYATLESSETFHIIDDATSFVQQGYYIAKIDLKLAYRSVRIIEDNQRITGLQFNLGNRVIYMRVTTFPFESRLGYFIV